ATSYGLGVLLTAAVEAGAREVVVGLGGSAVNDAGAGMLAALAAPVLAEAGYAPPDGRAALGAAPARDGAPQPAGVSPGAARGGSAVNDAGAGMLAALAAPVLDEAGYALPYGGAALVAAAALDGVPQLRGVSLVAATDVDNPLLGDQGASAVFGPQKGATAEDVRLLDAALARFTEVLERDLPTCPPGLAGLPGAGAAGGLGAALLALGGRRESGIELVRRLVGLDTVLDTADLVVTGEGSFDGQS